MQHPWITVQRIVVILAVLGLFGGILAGRLRKWPHENSMPRFRFTILGMMLAVAVVATIVALKVNLDRDRRESLLSSVREDLELAAKHYLREKQLLEDAMEKSGPEASFSKRDALAEREHAEYWEHRAAETLKGAGIDPADLPKPK